MPAVLPPKAKKVFQGVLNDVYQAPVEQFDGQIKTFEYVVRPDSVTIIAFTDPDHIIMTEQEQPGRDGAFVDLPGGRVDAGETHEQAAKRELAEETGYEAGRIMEFWDMTLKGSTRMQKTFYVATDLKLITGHVKKDNGEKVRIFVESLENVVKRCYKKELRQIDGMLCLMDIYHDQETRRRIQDWLNKV